MINSTHSISQYTNLELLASVAAAAEANEIPTESDNSSPIEKQACKAADIALPYLDNISNNEPVPAPLKNNYSKLLQWFHSGLAVELFALREQFSNAPAHSILEDDAMVRQLLNLKKLRATGTMASSISKLIVAHFLELYGGKIDTFSHLNLQPSIGFEKFVEHINSFTQHLSRKLSDFLPSEVSKKLGEGRTPERIRHYISTIVKIHHKCSQKNYTLNNSPLSINQSLLATTFTPDHPAPLSQDSNLTPIIKKNLSPLTNPQAAAIICSTIEEWYKEHGRSFEWINRTLFIEALELNSSTSKRTITYIQSLIGAVVYDLSSKQPLKSPSSGFLDQYNVLIEKIENNLKQIVPSYINALIELYKGEFSKRFYPCSRISTFKTASRIYKRIAKAADAT